MEKEEREMLAMIFNPHSNLLSMGYCRLLPTFPRKREVL